MRKKIIAVIAAAALLTLSACGTDNYSKKNKKSAAPIIGQQI